MEDRALQFLANQSAEQLRFIDFLIDCSSGWSAGGTRAIAGGLRIFENRQK